MRSHLLQNESDVHQMRELMKNHAKESTIVDFEEAIFLSSVRQRTRLWEANHQLVAFAYVDDFNNLQFEIGPQSRIPQIQQEIIEWGIEYIRKRNEETGQKCTLDASFRSENKWQIEMLTDHGFQQDHIRSLHYERDMEMELPEIHLPEGYHLRTVQEENEVNDLVALHRAAFGTDNMTVEMRIAIMKSPTYVPDLDFVLIAPDLQLTAFCICGFDDAEKQIGYTDPIGTHPQFQRKGLGKAIVSAGLLALRDRGVKKVVLGTSSENIAMQKLAESLGFHIGSESIWFCKIIS